MAEKRAASVMQFSDPPAKRRLDYEGLVRNLMVDEVAASVAPDEGDYGPPWPAYLPAPASFNTLFPNVQYLQAGPVAPSAPPFEASPAVELMPVEVPTGLLRYPSTVLEKDFRLTKYGGKVFRIGLDVVDFSPYIILMGEATQKAMNKWVRMTVTEFERITSYEFHSHVVNELNNGEKLLPLFAGGLDITVVSKKSAMKAAPMVSVQRRNSTVCITMALSSWENIMRCKKLMMQKLQKIHALSLEANITWTSSLHNCKDYLVQKGYKTKSSLLSLAPDHAENLIANGLSTSTDNFPVKLRDELLCYHFEFVRNKVFELM